MKINLAQCEGIEILLAAVRARPMKARSQPKGANFRNHLNARSSHTAHLYSLNIRYALKAAPLGEFVRADQGQSQVLVTSMKKGGT